MININQTFSSGFGANFFVDKKFICSFQWKNSSLLHFYAYYEKRDTLICSFCSWYYRKNGPCRHRFEPIEKPGSDVFTQCYNWMKD